MSVLKKAKSNLDTEKSKIVQQKKINEKIHKKISETSEEIHKKRLKEIEAEKKDLESKHKEYSRRVLIATEKIEAIRKLRVSFSHQTYPEYLIINL